MAKINEMADMKLSNVLGDNHKLNYQMFNFSFQKKKLNDTICLGR